MNILSFIIPVYNSSDTLSRCVDSILALEQQDYEIILVDDGSKDESGKLCDEYAEKYPFIKVIHQSNQGQAAARNAGLDIAAGEYILFCDSDDRYDTAKLSAFLTASLEEGSSDTFFASNISVNGEENGKYAAAETNADNNILFCTSRSSHDTVGYAIWNKLYRKEILTTENIRFFERNKLNNRDDWCEDMMFNLQYFNTINNVRQTGLAVYNLQTHNKSEEQLNNELGTRIHHMFNLFAALKQTDVYKKISDDDFSKVFVWHIKRTFYDYLKLHSLEEARKDIIAHPFGKTALACIGARLKDNQFFFDRYDKTTAEDYMNMLGYFLNGNMTKYKLKSALLWKIKAKGR